MSNNKDLDYKLLSELESNNSANEQGNIFDDDHEDVSHASFEELVQNYKINPKVKKRDELLNSDIILSLSSS